MPPLFHHLSVTAKPLFLKFYVLILPHFNSLCTAVHLLFFFFPPATIPPEGEFCMIPAYVTKDGYLRESKIMEHESF